MKLCANSMWVVAVLIVLGILPVMPARAALHVYEPFDYATGDLAGNNGGTGFSSAWQEPNGNKGVVWWPNAIETDAGGPSWDGVITNIPTSSALGEYRFAGGAATVTAYNRDLYRVLSSSLGSMAALATPTDELWMSVVVLNGSGGAFGLGVGDGYTRDRGRAWESGTTNFIGWAGDNGSWITKKNAMISTNAAARDHVITQDATWLSTSSPYVLVFKFKFNPGAGNDTCEMYAFDEGTALSEATFNASALSATIAGFDENACDVFSYAHNGRNNLIDEIRMGDTFDDVISTNLIGVTDRAKSSAVASPVAVPNDDTTTSTITVTIRDGFMAPQTNDTIALLGSTGNATISPASTNTDVNGQAVFTVKSSVNEVEVFTATNTTDSISIWQTASVAFQSGTDAGASTVTGNWDLAVADGVSTSAIIITLIDAGTGWPVVGNNVTLSGSTGNATISPGGAQVSDANGQVTFSVVSSTAETEVFTATDTTESVVITETFSVTFGAADSAALLVYEPFDYAVGGLVGQNGGTGFASAWTNPSNGEVGWVWDPNNGSTMGDGATMDWDGAITNIRVSTTLGENRFTGAGTAHGEAKRDIYRELSSSAGSMAGADGVLWMSAVIYHDPTKNVGIGLGMGDTIVRDRGGYQNFANSEVGAETAFIGSVRAWYGGGGDRRLNSVVATNRVNTSVNNVDYYVATQGSAFSEDDYVLVFKFRFSEINDEVQSYAFSEGTALSEATFDANKVIATFTNGFDEDACNILSWSSARGKTCLDEIRIGNTFDDVAPLPAPAGTLFFFE